MKFCFLLAYLDYQEVDMSVNLGNFCYAKNTGPYKSGKVGWNAFVTDLPHDLGQISSPF